ncbi:TRAP transporter large permease subunit [Sulfitobacter pontiacus]|uniref:TRAP transporter large permease subunit n=1 Tax=Sulfitobacter pontiacus TaxID=60137 RepID=UPI0038F60DE3
MLIPPSIILIIYGVIAEVSLIRLLAAGMLLGLLIVALDSGHIIIPAKLNPNIAAKRDVTYSNRDLLASARKLVPVLILMALILGAINSGIATPSEAVAIGLAATVLIRLALRQLNWSDFYDSLKRAVKVSAMITGLVDCAAVLPPSMS